MNLTATYIDSVSTWLPFYSFYLNVSQFSHRNKGIMFQIKLILHAGTSTHGLHGNKNQHAAIIVTVKANSSSIALPARRAGH